MTTNITLLDVQTAMMDRIATGKSFQAKELTQLGENLAGGRYLDGLPVSRIADRLMQATRKAGAIHFSAGWWYRDEKQSLPKLPIGSTSGRQIQR